MSADTFRSRGVYVTYYVRTKSMEHIAKSIAMCIINEACSVRIIDCCGYHTLSIPECPAPHRWISQAQSSNLGSDWTIFYHCRLKLPCLQRGGKHTTEAFVSIVRGLQNVAIQMFGSTEKHHCLCSQLFVRLPTAQVHGLRKLNR